VAARPVAMAMPVAGALSLRPGVGLGAARSRREAHPNHQPMSKANETPVRAPCVGDRGDHKAAGNKINSVDVSAETSTGRLAPGMRPWKARTGMDNSSQLRPSAITKNPVRGRSATHPSAPLTGGHHVEKERDKAEAARCLSTT